MNERERRSAQRKLERGDDLSTILTTVQARREAALVAKDGAKDETKDGAKDGAKDVAKGGANDTIIGESTVEGTRLAEWHAVEKQSDMKADRGMPNEGLEGDGGPSGEEDDSNRSQRKGHEVTHVADRKAHVHEAICGDATFPLHVHVLVAGAYYYY